MRLRFSATRSGETPGNLLGGTPGTLVVDAYTGNNKTCSPESRARAGCLAHVRRKSIDNTMSASALRVVALYRHNSLFVRDENLGHNLADLLTVLATCAANQVKPLHYLIDILPRVQDHPDSRLDELLPQKWTPVSPAPLPEAD